MSLKHFDILILGSGVAGLSTAIKIAKKLPNTSIGIVTKSFENESNTKYAQGGIAVVWDKLDSFESHIKDTMDAGDNLNNLDVVKMVISDAPDRLKELIEWGAEFDYDKIGDYDLGKEGGHSANRIIHHKDITGLEIENTLLTQVKNLPNIATLPHHFAIDLITDHHVNGKIKTYNKENISCYGAYVLNENTKEIETYTAFKTVVATGGAGQVYASTTNPVIATGDGIAMAYRAKAQINDIEFVQFHPSALYQPGISPAFLISEAVRGFGAYLVNKAGERFMFKVDERGELASRDIVARAIDNELNTSGEDCVYLDCRHLDFDKYINHFPNINEKCLSIGIDAQKDLIPVIPACHYFCGGIDVDASGRSSIGNMYACGEASRTGLHGANRLASNSLLEALVYGHNIAQDIVVNKEVFKAEKPIVPEWDAEGTTAPKELIMIKHNKKALQSVMSDFVSIVRSDERLDKALKRLDEIYFDTEEIYKKAKLSPQLCELRNLNAIAYLIVKESQKRKENKGAFFSLDC